jgi:hypothetical protein
MLVAADDSAPINALADRRHIADLAAASTSQTTQAIASILQMNEWLRRYQPVFRDT